MWNRLFTACLILAVVCITIWLVIGILSGVGVEPPAGGR